MQIHETEKKKVRFSKGAAEAGREGIRISKSHLDTLAIGQEDPDESGGGGGGMPDPLRFLSRKERAKWNRTPKGRQERILKLAGRQNPSRQKPGASPDAGKDRWNPGRGRSPADAGSPVARQTERQFRQALLEDLGQKRMAGGSRRSGSGRASGKGRNLLLPEKGKKALAGQAAKKGGGHGLRAASLRTGAKAAASYAARPVGIGAAVGKKAADLFREHLQIQKLGGEMAQRNLPAANRAAAVCPNMEMPPLLAAIRYGAAAAKGAVSVAASATAQAFMAALAPALSGILVVLVPIIAAISLILSLIGSVSSVLPNSAQAGYGLPTFVTQEMMEAFFQVQEESGIPVSSGIAQLVAESGFGSYGPGGEDGQGLSQLAFEYKNLFGIKYFSGDSYATGGVNMSTGEETGSGSVVVDASFAVYPDYAACIKQRGWMLGHDPYASHTSAYLNKNDGKYSPEDAKNFVEGIRAAGWATAHSYVEHCVSIMDQYDLYRFDNMTLEDYKKALAQGGSYSGNVTEQMQKIVEVASSNSGNYPCTPDMCAAWVTGVYQAAGAGTVPYGDAIDMWNTYQNTGSTSMENIPPGAIVCGSGSGYMGSLYGHVGIYLGNGMVANNIGSFSVETLSNWCAWQTATCQGHTGWIGWIYPGGVPQK